MGFKSRVVFLIKILNLGIINGYGTYGYNPNHGEAGNFSRIMNGLELEWEFGIAIGRAQRLKLWLFKFYRMGIGYRFSSQSDGVRIYFSSYFR